MRQYILHNTLYKYKVLIQLLLFLPFTSVVFIPLYLLFRLGVIIEYLLGLNASKLGSENIKEYSIFKRIGYLKRNKGVFGIRIPSNSDIHINNAWKDTVKASY